MSHKEQLVNSVSWNNRPSLSEPTNKTTQEQTVMLWCLQDLTFKCSDSRSLQMCKMRFSNSFYTHECRPDSGKKLPLNQILRWPTFIYIFFNPSRDGTQNGRQKLLLFQTYQVVPEPDAGKMSLGRRKLKKPRTWALFVSSAHAVTVQTGAVSKYHSSPPPPKKRRQKQELWGGSAGMRVNGKHRMEGRS
jgi:hypothetical protein